MATEGTTGTAAAVTMAVVAEDIENMIRAGTEQLRSGP